MLMRTVTFTRAMPMVLHWISLTVPISVSAQSVGRPKLNMTGWAVTICLTHGRCQRRITSLLQISPAPQRPPRQHPTHVLVTLHRPRHLSSAQRALAKPCPTPIPQDTFQGTRDHRLTAKPNGEQEVRLKFPQVDSYNCSEFVYIKTCLRDHLYVKNTCL